MNPRRIGLSPDPVRVVGACGLVLAASLCSAAPQGHPLPAGRVALNGCSIAPPRGEGWVLTDSAHGGWDIEFQKDEGSGRISRASVNVWRAPRIASGEVLVDSLRSQWERIAVQSSRKIQSLDLVADTSLGAGGVRGSLTMIDKNENWPLRDRLLISRRFVRIQHPDAPVVIDCGFMQGLPADGSLLEASSADSFIAGFQLVRVLVPIVSKEELPDRVTTFAPGDGVLWVSRHQDYGSSTSVAELIRIDPSDHRITGRTELPGTWPQTLRVAPDAVWGNDAATGLVWRLDPIQMRVVSRFETGPQARDLEIAGSVAWVGHSDPGRVSRIDVATGSVSHVTLPGIQWTSQMLANDGTLWVAGGGKEHCVLALDEKSGRPVGRRIPVDTSPRALAWADSSLWVLCGTTKATLLRLDPVARSVLSTLPLPGNAPGSLLSYGGYLWATDARGGWVMRVDPRTNAVVGEPGQACFHCSEAKAADGIWLFDEIARTLSRFRPGPP